MVRHPNYRRGSSLVPDITNWFCGAIVGAISEVVGPHGYTIKKTGAVREQWKYRLAVWREKMVAAKKDEVFAEAAMK